MREEVGADGLEPAEPKSWPALDGVAVFDQSHTATPHRNFQLGDYYSAIYNPRVHNTTRVTEITPGDPEMVFGLKNKAL